MKPHTIRKSSKPACMEMVRIILREEAQETDKIQGLVTPAWNEITSYISQERMARKKMWIF